MQRKKNKSNGKPVPSRPGILCNECYRIQKTAKKPTTLRQSTCARSSDPLARGKMLDGWGMPSLKSGVHRDQNRYQSMNDYIEIDDPKIISRLNRELANKLQESLPEWEVRDIGWPAGRFRAPVRFNSGNGKNLLWWAGRNHGTNAHNLFGHGNPGDGTTLTIDVQFNLPRKRFSRATSGAFLKEKRTGDFVLAHRGNITRGHGRLPKAAVFQEIMWTVRDAKTSSGLRDFIIIGDLAAPSLVHDLSSFAAEIRRTASAIRTPTGGKLRSKRQRGIFGKIRKYFDEFSGKRKMSSRAKTVLVDCHHGAVVRAIWKEMGAPQNRCKSREIDLVVVKGRKAFLFEVKTSANIQSIYKAIGQLSVHAPTVAALGNVKTEKVIVLPERPPDQIFKLLTNDLKIQVLTFTRSSHGRISIAGIDAL